MRPGPNDKVFETITSIMWFDENGILCSHYKEGAVLTKESLAKSFEIIKSKIGGKRICWVGEITNGTAADKATRDLAAAETPDFIKALALISQSPFASMAANLFLALGKPPYPTKVFTSENKAKEWIKQFLDKE